MNKRKRPKIRLALVDEHPIVRRGIEAFLSRHSRIRVVSQASTVDEVLRAAADNPPDVVVLDTGAVSEATRALRRRHPKTKIVVFASFQSSESVHQAMAAGVDGYLLKTAVPEELVRAIETAYSGEVYFSPPVSQVIVDSYARRARKGRESELTPRELEVLKLVAEGRTSKDIARALGLSIRTVETHREHIIQKLDIHSAAGLTRFAIARGIIKAE